MISLVQARQERTRRLVRVPREDSDFYPFGGGLNLIDSPLSSEPGQCQNALNYEMGFEGGYKRVGGYQTADGRPYVAEPNYYRLPVGLTLKSSYEHDSGSSEYRWPIAQELLRGRSSGAMGCIVDHDQSGGYGSNVLLHNTTFQDDEWDWDAGTGTIDIDLRANHVFSWTDESAIIGQLTKWIVNSSGAGTMIMQALNDPIAIALGEYLYISVLARWDFENAQNFEGLSLRIGNAVGDPFGLPSAVPTIDFDVKNGAVNTVSDHFFAAGVTPLSDGVLRLWARTKACTTADATMTLEIACLQETSPGVFTDSWDPASHFMYVSMPHAVVMPVRTPMNYTHARDLESSTEYSNKTQLAISNAGGDAWASGVYPDFARMTETTDGGNTTHYLSSNANPDATGNKAWIRCVKGDQIYVEFYAKFVASREGLFLNWGGNGGHSWINNLGHHAGWNLETGLLYDTWRNSQAAPLGGTASIESVGTDIYLCKFLTDVVDYAGLQQFLLNMATDGVDPTDAETFYTGNSSFLDITGMRVISMPFEAGATAATVDIEKQLAEVITLGTAKNVNTGYVILAGETLGPDFIDGEEIEVITPQPFNTPNPDILVPEARLVGTASGPAGINDEINSTLDTQYTAAALEIAVPGPTDRQYSHNSTIDPAPTPVIPPGSGPIRGITYHNGFAFCFRDDAAGQYGVLWKSSGVGWRQAAWANFKVAFDAGTGTEPLPGQILTNTSVTKPLLIIHVETTSGDWGTDAAGFFWVKDIDPTNWNGIGDGAQLQVDAINVALVDFVGGYIGADLYDDHYIKFAAGGRYEFREHNFYGSTDRKRLYWVNGENIGYEWWDLHEGLAGINTGMVDDRPTHIAVHNQHLFYSFRGGSVQLSGDGDPHLWTVITGASEIGVGDTITGFNEEVGNSLFIFTRDQSHVLQGNTRANFDLDDFNINAGAHEWSVQRIGLGMFFDDRGFTSMLQTQRAGSVNFQENAQSELIQPLVENLVKNAEVTCSHLIRKENIYRCYFDDGRVVSIGFQKHEISGHMLLEYPFKAIVAVSAEAPSGAERIFVGTAEGNVYELETGASFDGDPVTAFMRTVLYQSKSPGRMKKYSHARIDGTFRGALTLVGRIEADFDDPDWNLGAELDFSNLSAGGYWDNFAWDEFIWDRATSGNPQEKVEVEGTNISVYLRTTSAIDKVHTLRGVSLQWTPRRDDRRT